MLRSLGTGTLRVEVLGAGGLLVARVLAVVAAPGGEVGAAEDMLVAFFPKC